MIRSVTPLRVCHGPRAILRSCRAALQALVVLALLTVASVVQAQTGVLTDNSYVQLVGDGVAAIDVGFPMRYSHSSLEVCDLRDLKALTQLLVAAVSAIGPDFSLDRDASAG